MIVDKDVLVILVSVLANKKSIYVNAGLFDFLSFFLQFKYANYKNANYTKTGKTSLKFQLINQRGDFSFALFSGGLSNVSIFPCSANSVFFLK